MSKIKNIITLQNFDSHNRDRWIGNSLYRICRENDDSGKWYIYECYTDGSQCIDYKGYYYDDLKDVIDKLNSFTKEKEVVSLRF